MQRTGIIGMKTYERRVNMVISATELKMNLGYYLELSEREDIHITKNGKTVASICSGGTGQLNVEGIKSAVDELENKFK